MTHDYTNNYIKNRDIIKESGIPHEKTRFNGNTMVYRFRQKGKPTVDFYPYTGKWKILKGRPFKDFAGGAKAFLEHYASMGE